MEFTDDPVRDAERFFEHQEREYDEQNRTEFCECCGKPCGAEPHYKIFDMTACSKECAKKLLDEDAIEEIVDDYIDEQMVGR